MATEIIRELESYNSSYHLKNGIVFCFTLIIAFFLFKNINHNNSIPFVATFNYVEGIDNDSEVQIAGIKIGNVNNITLSSDGVTIYGEIDRKYDIPEDSIIKIKSDGVFGKKAISIEPGFGEYLNKSNQQYVFKQTQDSYSVDMFLRYLNELNE